MGLFNLFKGDAGETMTPHKAFAISLIYCMGSDGEMDPEEIGHLLAVIGGERDGAVIGVGANNRALLDSAMKYVRRHTPEQFLAEAAPILTPAQKLCILMNIADSAMSDGEAELEEQALFDRFQQAFGIRDEEFRPYFQVIMMKNDRSVFIDADHPNNRPDFKIEFKNAAA